MAHQATNIPWGVLASNLKWCRGGRRPGNGDLELQFRPQQGKELKYFAEAFVRNVREHAKTARKKYPDTYQPPHPDSVLLDDAVVRRISPTIRRWRVRGINWVYHTLFQPLVESPDGGLCRHTGMEQCRCLIPYKERRASSFYRKYRSNTCYNFFEENGEAFFNQEVVKTLLLYGEMDTILRVCAIPDVLKDWWEVAQCYCMAYDAGWNQVVYRALTPYLALNMIYCFPETWDDASGRTDEKDYRLMGVYQSAIRGSTYSDATSTIPAHPHRRFFGIEDNQFKDRYGQTGQLPLETFLNCDRFTPQKPTPLAVRQVQQMLHIKGLPTELVLDILELAEYEPGEGRLKVPHDPFHPENREELAKYLKYCWTLLVRCEMMANAIGMELPWMDVMHAALSLVLDSARPRRRKWDWEDHSDLTYEGP